MATEINIEELVQGLTLESTSILGAKKPKGPIPPFPTPHTICWNTPPYQPIPFDGVRDVAALNAIKLGHFSFDRYCPFCQAATTFRTLGDNITDAMDHLREQSHQTWAATQIRSLTLAAGQFIRHLVCARNGHLLTYAFMEGPWAIVKIGQYPSMEDLSAERLAKYKAQLGKHDLGEMAKAERLFSFKYGVGAFIYLRRIFENLIDRHRTHADPDGSRFPNFTDLPMDEKIDRLKDGLPPMLVGTRATYRILSTGVHELAEDQCIAYYPVIRDALLMILEQDRRQAEQRAAEAKLEADIGAIAGELKPRE